MPGLTRRQWLSQAGMAVCAIHLSQNHSLQARENRNIAEAVAKGRAFLVSLLDPAVDLLPEYSGANIYWLFHDNYLAAKVLQQSNPEVATRIQRAIRRLGVARSGKIEIVFDESPRPLPFRHYKLITIKQVGKKILKTEVVGREPFQGWQEFADLLLFASIALAKSEPGKGRRSFEAAQKLWDGIGFRDQVARSSSQYATYKLALYLLAAAKLKVRSPIRETAVKQLLALQANDGGWITDYDSKGRPRGLANVETTSLAILALSRLTADF
jgi:hypothetical protein